MPKPTKPKEKTSAPDRGSRACPIVSPSWTRRQAESHRWRRDRAIMQLWRGGWTSKRIAVHLRITPAIVSNVTHRNGAARRVRNSSGIRCAERASWESYCVYFWKVMETLFQQADAHAGVCPPFVTIPEPADEFQREQIMGTIDWWARQSFGVRTIEIHIEQNLGGVGP